MTTGEILRMFRKSNNCTLKKLSEVTEISCDTLSKLEKESRTNNRIIFVLIDTYGITLKQFTDICRELAELDIAKNRDFKLAMFKILEVQLSKNNKMRSIAVS